MLVKLGTEVNYKDKELKNNYRYNKDLDERLREFFRETIPLDTDPLLKRHKARKKLFVRDRIDYLLDEGSSFLEIGALAGLGVYKDVRPGAGLVAGIGRISGRDCMIVANDATLKGGAYFPLTVKKHIRAQEIALENNLPCIYLVDSGGAFLPLQDEVFPDKDHFGRIFFNQAVLSSKGIYQVAVVMGSCTAGGAYVPAMCDESVIVKDQGAIFLGGPPLVKAATGVDISAEELGGGVVHTKISGVADHLADDDYHALEITKGIVANLGRGKKYFLERSISRDPLYPKEDIFYLLPANEKKYFPIREILARLLDNSEIYEFKKNYGDTLICGFAHILGYKIGIVANDGILFSESALKGAHFIQLCNQRKIPLLFIQNISGFMVGKEYEHGGIAKNGAKMVTAVSCSTVPKLTLIVGGSFGAGNYAMSGRGYSPRFLFTWPNAKIAVMGPKQAASVLTQVRADSYKHKKIKWSAKERRTYKEKILKEYEEKSSAFYATARLWDDGILPVDKTREALYLALRAVDGVDIMPVKYGIFRM